MYELKGKERCNEMNDLERKEEANEREGSLKRKEGSNEWKGKVATKGRMQ
jgi:hypothetical protein